MLSPKTAASRTFRALLTALTLVSLVAPAAAQKAPPPPAPDGPVRIKIVAPEGRHVANGDLDYQFRVTNRGPDDAPRLELHGSGFSSNEFVSATPPEHGGGRCRQNGSNFASRLGPAASSSPSP